MSSNDPRHRLEHALDVFEATIAPAAKWYVRGCSLGCALDVLGYVKA